MKETEDTQQLHNNFVEPLQVETSNSTTNSNCAKLSPEEISTDNQESKGNDYVFTHIVNKRGIDLLKQQLDNIDIEKYRNFSVGIIITEKPGIDILVHDILFS